LPAAIGMSRRSDVGLDRVEFPAVWEKRRGGAPTFVVGRAGRSSLCSWLSSAEVPERPTASHFRIWHGRLRFSGTLTSNGARNDNRSLCPASPTGSRPSFESRRTYRILKGLHIPWSTPSQINDSMALCENSHTGWATQCGSPPSVEMRDRISRSETPPTGWGRSSVSGQRGWRKWRRLESAEPSTAVALK
jgi:hypothetical protein